MTQYTVPNKSWLPDYALYRVHGEMTLQLHDPLSSLCSLSGHSMHVAEMQREFSGAQHAGALESPATGPAYSLSGIQVTLHIPVQPIPGA